jgi:hypothetical protein
MLIMRPTILGDFNDRSIDKNMSWRLSCGNYSKLPQDVAGVLCNRIRRFDYFGFPGSRFFYGSD